MKPQAKRPASLAAAHGYAVRSMNPRQGDFVVSPSGASLVEVMSVSDGVVRYEVRGKGWKHDREAELEDWPRLMRRALDKGATFNAA